MVTDLFGRARAVEEARIRPDQIVARAERVKIVITDCDGVLTDNGVYYSAGGEEMKRFSIRDGMGVERLRDHGIQTAIVTGENAESVARRAEKLGALVRLGAKNKVNVVTDLAKDLGIEPGEIAYIGDDVNDLDVMTRIAEAGLVAAPRDAMLEVEKVVHYVSRERGGEGAFRDFAELILFARTAEAQALWRR